MVKKFIQWKKCVKIYFTKNKMSNVNIIISIFLYDNVPIKKY